MLLVFPLAVDAHGGPPSALGIVAADSAGQPSMVLLNEGLALAREDLWWFLCPRLWGDPDTSSGKSPLARSVDGTVSWIIGADDLYAARDGVLTPQARPDLSSAAIVALAASDDALFGLRVTSEGSAVVRIDDAAKAELFTSAEFWSSLAASDAGLELARIADGGVIVRATIDRDGQVLAEQSLAVGGTPGQVRLRPTPRGLFAVVYDGTRYTLAAVEPTGLQVLLESAWPIHGPQASANGTLWVALDTGLMRQVEPGAAFEAVAEPRQVTCLEQWGSLTYACAGSELYRLGDDGLAARLFELDHLSEPDPELVPAPAERDCGFQWLLYRNDLVRTGLSPRDVGENEADDAGVATADDAAAPSPPDDAGAVAPPTEPADEGSCDCTAVGARARVTPLPALLLAAVAASITVVARTRTRRQRPRSGAR